MVRTDVESDELCKGIGGILRSPGVVHRICIISHAQNFVSQKHSSIA